MLSTPIDLIESYFEVQLNARGIKALQGIPDEQWIDFAKQYEATMNRSFAADFLDQTKPDTDPVSLYFEPTLRDNWDRAVGRLCGDRSPLIGMSSDPKGDVDVAYASRILQPFKKHLLLADSVYIRDSFFFSFYPLVNYRRRSSGDPNEPQQLPFHVGRLKTWLPLLMHLRPLIDSRALVFTPDWLTPSFSDHGYSIERMNELKLGIRPTIEEPGPPLRFELNAALRAPIEPPSPFDPGPLDEYEVITTWLNARRLGLNPVFPDRSMYDYSSLLYFRDDSGTAPSELTSDLFSFEVLPLRTDRTVGIGDLVSIRENEEGFAAIRAALTTCQQRMANGLAEQLTQDEARVLCADILEGYQEEYGGTLRRAVKFIDDNPIATTVFTLAVGASLIPTAGISALIAAFAPALLSPKIAKLGANKLNPSSRALSQLQALI